MASLKVRRERKANFTDLENKVLLANIQKFSRVLFGKIPFGSTGQQKALAWLKVAKAVNSVSTESRTLEEVKNRWKKHKATFKKRTVHGYEEGDSHLNDEFSDEWMKDDPESDSIPMTPGLNMNQSSMSPLQIPKLEPDVMPSSYVPSYGLPQPQSIIPQQQLPQPKPPDVDDRESEEVCLRWNSHHSNMKTSLPNLLDREQYVDCTLAIDGKMLKCHRLILSSCSAYFDEILSTISVYQHPVVFLKGVPYWIIKSLIDFMYAGEVHIDQNKLQDLLEVAETLKIKGLAGKAASSSDDKPRPPPKKPAETPSAPPKLQAAPKAAVPTIKRIPEMSTSSMDVSTRTMEVAPTSPMADPLALLQPAFYEDNAAESSSKGNSAGRKQITKKVRKRRLSDHEPPQPQVIFRKGTKSRPHVKFPKHYHDDYESVNIKSLHNDDSNEFTIKNEPIDIDENYPSYGNDPDLSTKEANENLNILDSLRLKCRTPETAPTNVPASKTSLSKSSPPKSSANLSPTNSTAANPLTTTSPKTNPPTSNSSTTNLSATKSSASLETRSSETRASSIRTSETRASTRASTAKASELNSSNQERNSELDDKSEGKEQFKNVKIVDIGKISKKVETSLKEDTFENNSADDMSLLESKQIISKMESSGAMEVTPISNVRKS